MTEITVVIPTYNRERNLSLALRGLTLQSDKRFRVVVADDGSTDETLAVVKRFETQLDLQYCRQTHSGYRVSRVRNMGVRLARPETTHVWFIDSDIVLSRNAAQEAHRLTEKYKHRVICGSYYWLPPMIFTEEEIVSRWDLFTTGAFPSYTPEYDPGIVGPDPRSTLLHWDTEELIREYGGATLSGNLIVPRHLIDKTGGFDENIEGQGQDGEFGHHLQQVGAGVTFSTLIRGWHVHHYRDTRWQTESVRETIKYIHAKYNLPLTDSMLPSMPPKVEPKQGRTR